MNRKLKYLTLISILGSFGACSSGGTTPPSQQRLVQTNIVDSQGSEITLIYKYDDRGNLLSQSKYENGEITGMFTYNYSFSGQLLTTGIDQDVDGVVDYVGTYRYSPEGELLNSYNANSEGLILDISVYSYQDGLISASDYLDIVDVRSPEAIDIPGAQLQQISTYNYNNDRIANESKYNASGELLRTRTFSFNPDGTADTATINTVSQGATATYSYIFESGRCDPKPTLTMISYFCVD